jgi:chromosome segregation ATPase
MVLRKIGILVCLIPVILTSCEFASNHEGRGDNALERDQMKDDLLRQMTSDIFYQDSILRVIQMELNKIDALYIAFEGSTEVRGTGTNQANAIINRIRNLNSLLEKSKNDLRNSSVENAGLLRMIDRFKKELSDKETKIAELQQTVREREKVIEQKETAINLLEIANTRQKDEINKLEQELRLMKANAYGDLGDLMLQIASEIPDVRGLFTRRTREDVGQMQESLIKDAYRYFDQAAVYGSSYARQMAEELQTTYAFLR